MTVYKSFTAVFMYGNVSVYVSGRAEVFAKDRTFVCVSYRVIRFMYAFISVCVSVHISSCL